MSLESLEVNVGAIWLGNQSLKGLNINNPGLQPGDNEGDILRP